MIRLALFSFGLVAIPTEGATLDRHVPEITVADFQSLADPITDTSAPILQTPVSGREMEPREGRCSAARAVG